MTRPTRTRPLAALCAAMVSCLVVWSADAAAQNAPSALQVKTAVKVAADSVRVGDPFRVTIGVRAPPGATIDFPRQLDTSGAVQSLDPVNVRSSADTSAVEQYADYRVAASGECGGPLDPRFSF